MRKVKKSGHIYKIFAERKTSEHGQKVQAIRCCVLEAHRSYLIVESLKRYNQVKYAGSNKATGGKYAGMPVRRINIDQIGSIFDEALDRQISYNTVRRREGTIRYGRARGGK